jgi:tight adherence protein C
MSPLMTIAMVVGAAALGFIGPDYVVNSKIRSRQEAIRAQLPDALDLLAVSVEAGLGFDSAVSKLIDSLEGPLIDEFNLTLSEVRVGESRPEALRKLSERAGVSELSAFTRALIQADTLGISLGRILRVQAADTRERRQSLAEERAMKAPIKMLFPTVLFIFPSMFIVTIGPAFLSLTGLFSGAK